MSELNLKTCPSANGQSSVINPLQVTGFEFLISRIPGISFFIKEITIPSLTLSPAEQVTPFVNIPRTGDKIQYSEISFRLMIDEEMKNYRAILDWMKKIGFDRDWKQVSKWRKEQGDKMNYTSDKDILLVSDATLCIKGQNLKNVSNLIFKDIWPTSLGSISFSDEATETQYVYCDVSFACRSFEFCD